MGNNKYSESEFNCYCAEKISEKNKAKLCERCTSEANDIPQKLYKYKSLQNLDHIFDILYKKRLYCSSVDQFNDPMEFNFNLTFDKDLEDKKEFFKSNTKYKLNARDSLEESIRDFETRYRNSNYLEATKKKCGVFCFSESFINSSLWSYYADSHKGICIEFDVSTTFDKKIAKVIYQNDLPIVNFYDQNIPERDEYKLFITKHEKYLQETEYRCMSQPAREYNPFNEIGSDIHISRLYLGVNCKQNMNYWHFLSMLETLCPDLEVVQLQMCKEKYKLIEGEGRTAKCLYKDFIYGLFV